MNSILDQVAEYINEKGIPFNNVSLNYNCFPSYYNQAILNYVRKLSDVNYDMGIPEYKLSFDNNGSIYLMIHDNNGRVNLCISNVRLCLDDNIKYTQVPEIDVIEEACVLKLLNDDRLMIRDMIKDNYQELSMLDKVKMENNIINTLVKNYFRKAIKNNDNILDKVSYKEEIDRSIGNITRYIDYLNNYYLEDLKLEEKENMMMGIHYEVPDTDTVIRKSSNKEHTLKQERINPIIPANDRISVLNNYHYLYRDFAYSSSIKEIEYINYLYKLDNNKFLLVMEPYNGNKYTKMAIIESNYIDKDNFNELVKHYLELSYSEFDLSGNTVKTKHTSLNVYEQIFEYVIKGNDIKLNNVHFKDKIKKIKE